MHIVDRDITIFKLLLTDDTRQVFMEDIYLTSRLITYRTTVSQPQGRASKHKQRKDKFSRTCNSIK
jgi:hypothetical protein